VRLPLWGKRKTVSIKILNYRRKEIMGKGDRRTRRGKLFRRTHGKRRPKKKGAKKTPAK